MGVVSQFDGRKVMQLSQAARFMSATLRMLTKALMQHEEKTKEKEEQSLRDAIFTGGKPDTKKIEDILGQSCVRFDSDGIHFDDHISVRLIKNYVSSDLSVAMSENDVGCIRLVSNSDGMIAVLYSSLDEDKMESALKSMEISLGASPVVSSETLEKMSVARNSSLISLNGLSFADVRRLEYAAGKYGLAMSVSKERSSNLSNPKYTVKAIATDEKKMQKALRDVAIYRVKDNADSFERDCKKIEAVTNLASEKVKNKEVFYVCSPSRPDAYIEVNENNFRVITQENGVDKEAKFFEGSPNDSKHFAELCNELFAFENPTILSKEDFSHDPDERLKTVVADLTVLEQKNEGKAFVSDLTATVLTAANNCDIPIQSTSDLLSAKLRSAVEHSSLSNKETVISAIDSLARLPREMIDEPVKEYRSTSSRLENELARAVRENAYNLENSIENDTPERFSRTDEEKE